MTGASSKEAARSLGISPRTVEFHRANIMQKLGARNMVDLVHKVLANTPSDDPAVAAASMIPDQDGPAGHCADAAPSRGNA